MYDFWMFFDVRISKKGYNLNLSRLYNQVAVLLVELHILSFGPFDQLGILGSNDQLCYFVTIRNINGVTANLVWAVSMVTHTKCNAFSFLKRRLSPPWLA